MKAELKQKWIAALSGGQYQQGSGVLRDKHDRFCCLGVLCDVVDSSGWRELKPVDTCIANHEFEVEAYSYLHEANEEETTLPDALQKRIGLTLSEISKLISLNDAGNDFGFIARHIEHNIAAE
jgi:hypothetical protein